MLPLVDGHRVGLHAAILADRYPNSLYATMLVE